MEKVIVTGASGYLGSRLVDFLLSQKEFEIVLAGRSEKRLKEVFGSSIDTVDIHSLLEGNNNSSMKGVDCIIHLAALNEIECEKDPAYAFEVNFGMTKKLLDQSVKHRVKRFIYLSTVHVYGNGGGDLIDENTIPHPVHPYAYTHYLSENYVWEANRRKQITGITVRLSNSFGYPFHQGIDRWSLIVNNLCQSIAETGIIHLKTSGEQVRDFVTITDAVRGVFLLLTVGEEVLGDGVFNLCSSNLTSIKEMAVKIGEICEKDLGFFPKLHIKDIQHKSDQRSFFSIEKIKRIGYSPLNNFEDEIGETLKRSWSWFHG